MVLKKLRRWLDIRSCPPEKQTDFWVNLLIGLGIATAFIILEYTVWGQRNINMQMDYFVRKEADQSVRKGPDDSGLLAFIDIDDAAYKNWGRPALTPRDKVAELIALAASGGAKIIISDMYFAEPDYTPSRALNAQEAALSGAERDGKLRRTLVDIQAAGKTKVFLPAVPYADGVLKNSLFDDLIDNKNILRGIPFSLISRYDGLVRYWRPCLLVQNTGSKDPVLLWSIPFYAAVTAAGDPAELEAWSRQLAQQPASAPPQLITIHLQNNAGTHAVAAYANGMDIHHYHRIRYLLAPEGMNRLDDATNLYNSTWKVSARGTLAPPEKAREFFRDKIVIIGNSSPDWSDKYLTPLGEMPGMYIQGNIINTIVNLRQIEKPPLIVYCLVQIIVVLLAAYAFLHFRPFLSQIMVSLVLWLICWLAYLFFLQTGIFVNILFSLIGIGVHELLVEIGTILKRRQELAQKFFGRLRK